MSSAYSPSIPDAPGTPQRPERCALASSVEPEGPRLTLTGHLEELRRRLGISLAVLLAAMGLSALQAERLLQWLVRPVEDLVPQFAFFSPAEPLLAYLKVVTLSGLTLAVPVILWQGWAFVRTALTQQERWYGRLFVWWGSVQFLAGGAFAYYVLIPVSLQFLLRIGEHFLMPIISIDRYLGFIITLMLWCGVAFELPVVLFLLARIGIVTPEWLRQQRPAALIGLVTLAALITPTTDPFNLLLMAAPMALLYEGSILVTRLAMSRRRAS